MKHFTFALIATAALLSALGCASKDRVAQHQQAAAHRHFQDYEAAQKRMSRLQEQARARMLQTLSPTHKRLLAKVVGQLAVARSPQIAEAANQIDTMLTPREKQTILSISASVRNQWLSNEAQQRERGMRRAFVTNDPGLTLLLTVTTYTARQASATAHAASSRHEIKPSL